MMGKPQLSPASPSGATTAIRPLAVSLLPELRGFQGRVPAACAVGAFRRAIPRSHPTEARPCDDSAAASRCHAAKTGPSSANISTASMPLRAPQRLDRLLRGLRDRAGDVERRVHRDLDADAAAERLEIGIGERIGLLAHDLQPAGAVGVDDGGNASRAPPASPAPSAPCSCRRCNRRPTRRRTARTSAAPPRSVIIGASGRIASRYLTRSLSTSRVRGIAGIGEDRAMAERARTGFRRALEQRDDAVLRGDEGHQVGDRLAPAGGAMHRPG